MTFEQTRRTRYAYIAFAILAYTFGPLFVFVTFLKSLYNYFQQSSLDPITRIFANFIGIIASESYNNVFIIRWLWPWMSDANVNNRFETLPFDLLLCPTFIFGIVLTIVAKLLWKNATRLRTWMRDAKALLAKEDMRTSLRPGTSRQAIGGVHAGRDVRIRQEITNLYKNRPDNPKTPLIVAFIGAIAAIVAAIINRV